MKATTSSTKSPAKRSIKSVAKAASKKGRTIHTGNASRSKSITAQMSDAVSSSMDSVMKIDRSTLIWGLAGAATVGAGAYLLYRSWNSGQLSALWNSEDEQDQDVDQDELSEQNTDGVSEKLPLGVSAKKPSPSIRDEEGNYDMDGVSYDVQGVVVGSDAHKNANGTI